MKPIHKQFLKIFLITGVTYGIVMVLIQGKFVLGKFLLHTIFYGLGMAFFLIAMQKYFLKKSGKDFSDDDVTTGTGVTKRKTVNLHLPPHLLLDALREDHAINSLKISQKENFILLKTGVTWRSWGEEIGVQPVEVLEDDYLYEIVSKSKLATTLVDYGKNRENVEMIETALRRADERYVRAQNDVLPAQEQSLNLVDDLPPRSLHTPRPRRER